MNASNVAFCWGDNTWGQLGDNSKTRRLKPVRLAADVHFLRLTAGAIHSCGIATDNHGYCWGKNGFGELGDGTAATRLKPTAVAGGRSWRQIWAGSSLLVEQADRSPAGSPPTSTRSARGDNAIGQLGVGNPFGSPVPEAVSGSSTFAAITAGLGHACAITTSDLWNTSAHAYCWGNDANNQLGNGAGGGTLYDPSEVAGGLPLTWVTAGAMHTCALTGAGQAYCWGTDGWDELRERRGRTAEHEPDAGGRAVAQAQGRSPGVIAVPRRSAMARGFFGSGLGADE